jgi:uncharacterized protein Smg (DUF494 family)
MATASVFDIVIYLFDHYMLAETALVTGRAHLERDLEQAGFAPGKVARAFDCLTELACAREHPAGGAAPCAGRSAGVRVYSGSEQARLPLPVERLGALIAHPGARLPH